MLQRGRKSAAALAVIGPNGIETIRRPDPPACLGEDEQAEWWKIVNAMPADYFTAESHAVLEARCCHIVQRRRFMQAIQIEMNSNEFDLHSYRNLCRSAVDESRIITMLDTALRLTHHSRYDSTKRTPKSGPKTPWPTAKEG